MTREEKKSFKPKIFLWLLKRFGLYWGISVGLLLILSLLYRQNMDLVLYFALVLAFVLIWWLLRSWQNQYRGVQNLMSDSFGAEDFPEEAEPYQLRLLQMQEELARMRIKARHDQADQLDYFSLWAHQAKLPAAAMSLLLQEENPDPKELQIQLQRLEQYISMAMSYIRLNAESTDYVIGPVDLNEVIRPVVRSFASACIRKHLKVEVDLKEKLVLSDAKWLQTVIEQLFSNAVKYSDKPGTIRIASRDNTLVIEDEGAGIPAEDLPRVLERGFTGQRGRDQISQSSGIGLYLCRTILERLKHGFRIESEPGKGTRITIVFPEKNTLVD